MLARSYGIDDDSCPVDKLNFQLIQSETKFLLYLVKTVSRNPPFCYPYPLSLHKKRKVSIDPRKRKKKFEEKSNGEMMISKPRIQSVLVKISFHF